VIGEIIIGIGILFIAIGMFGVLRYNDFFTRLLIAAKVDTVGFITVMIGAALASGWDIRTLKIIIILGFVAITGPLINHSIGNSAISSGMKPKKRKDADD
jgi:multicomponent Na+:H+ antiporter subunit G